MRYVTFKQVTNKKKTECVQFKGNYVLYLQVDIAHSLRINDTSVPSCLRNVG